MAGRRHREHDVLSEEDEDVWGSADDVDESRDTAPSWAPFQVRPFSSGSAVEEMFNFSKYEAGNGSDNGALAGGGSGLGGVGGGAGLGGHTAMSSPSMEMLNTRAATTNSATSAITDLSAAESASSPAMSLPFPFHGRPKLPHVDVFVPKVKLSYDHLRMMNMYEKKALVLKMQLKAPAAASAASLAAVSSKAASHASYASESADTATGYGALRKHGPGHADTFDADPTASSMDIRQILKFIDYIQFFGEQDRNSEGYRGITYPDLETAFHMHSRGTLDPTYTRDDTMDLLMVAFEDLLQKRGWTPTEWFQRNKMEVAGNEPKLSKELFNRSIRRMCRKRGLPPWINQDMRQLRLHLSVPGSDEPTLPGILRAFRLFHAMHEEKVIREHANPIITRIRDLMHRRKIRIIDFFYYVDADPANAVPAAKLAHAINELLNTRSAVPLHSPLRGSSKVLPLSPDAVAAGSVGSLASPSRTPFASASPEPPHNLSPTSSVLSSKSSPSRSLAPSTIVWDTSSMVGMGTRKAGKEAVRAEPVPADMAMRLQQRYEAAQKSLYNNGMVYTGAEGKRKIGKVTMASLHPALGNGSVFMTGAKRGGRASFLGKVPGAAAGGASSTAAGDETKGSRGSSPNTPAAPPPPPPPQPPKPPNWTSLTLSPKFTQVAEKRAAQLIQSMDTYDQKREHHRRVYDAFF